MKTITKFRAEDGTEFKTKEECLNYENLVKNVNNIMVVLSPRPKDDGCRFSNGEGFVQHDIKTLRKVRVNLLKEIKKHIRHEWVQQTIDDETVHPSYMGRLLDDCGIIPLNNAWSRLMCIDNLGREWGQPYYADHPEKAKQICIGGVTTP